MTTKENELQANNSHPTQAQTRSPAKSLLSVRSADAPVENGAVPVGGKGNGSPVSHHSRSPSLRDDDDASSEIARVEAQTEDDDQRKKTALGRLARTLRAFDVSKMDLIYLLNYSIADNKLLKKK